MEMGGNRCWKLGVQEYEDSEIEEVVLRIQGVVCNCELPPIQSPFKMYVINIWGCREQYSYQNRQPNR